MLNMGIFENTCMLVSTAFVFKEANQFKESVTSFAVFSTPTIRTKTTGLGSKERYCHDLHMIKEEKLSRAKVMKSLAL